MVLERFNLQSPLIVKNKKHHKGDLQNETETTRKDELKVVVGKSKNIKRLSEIENELGSKKNGKYTIQKKYVRC